MLLKKSLQSILIAGVFSSALLAKESVFEIKNEIANTNIKVVTNKEKFKEVKTIYRDNKEQKRIITLRNQKTGKIESISNYKFSKENGLSKDGMETNYYPSGNIKEKVNYRKGLINGAYVKFRENGSTISNESYTKNLKEGDSYYFDDQNKLIEKITYKNNKRIN